jgi:intracellular sulfur oxidation DsrE/DsrF family protein
MDTNSNFIIHKYNAETNEVIEIVAKGDELIEIETMLHEQRQWQIEYEAEQAEKKIKRQAAEAKLEALGLDADDLKALGL